eukprot:4710698-Karenia_brevis.AAC.1
MWVPPGKHPGGVTTPWKTNGVWLGIANFGASTANWLIGVDDGRVVEARNFKRLPPSEMWDAEL